MVVQNRNSAQRLFLTNDRRLNLFWRILLFVFLYFLLNALFALIGKGLDNRLPSNLGYALYALLIIPITFWLTYRFRHSIDKRSWRGVGLTPLSTGLPIALLGFILSGVMLGLVFALQYAFGWIHITGVGFGTTGMVSGLGYLLVGLLFLGIAPGFTEELVMRGYVFQNLGASLPIWLATVINGILFGLLHFTPLLQAGLGMVTLFYVIFTILATVFLVLSRLGTRTIWLAIGWHAGWDWFLDSVSGLGAVNDPTAHPLFHLKPAGPVVLMGGSSGAAAMLEGGPVSLLVLLLGIALLLVWTNRRRQVNWRARLNDEGEPILR